MSNVSVLSAPLFAPDIGRSDFEVPVGTTIAEIVAQSLPGLPEADHMHLRVVLVSTAGSAPVRAGLWHRVRPRSGVKVVLRMVPQGDSLRSVLLAVVSIAAVALGQVWAPAVAGQLGIGTAFAGSLVTAGLTIVGSLLVNALVPVRTPDTTRRSSYAISGWRNDVRQGAPVPFPLGRHRYAPPFAATSYTEIVGDTQYVRALFTFGAGPLQIDDIRIGDTPLSEFDEIEIETREGRATDNPVSLYPRQVIEEATNTELFRPLPRDDAGEPTGGAAIETPVVRYTATQAERASVIIGFPSGLFRVDDGGDVQSQTVEIRIRQRAEGGLSWSDVTTLQIAAQKRESFFRQHSWTLPARGRWEIEVTRMTDETTSTQISDRSVLAALQSIRPEYPIAMSKPLSLLSIRAKATHQLNGGLDAVNAVVQRYAPMWDGNDWVEGLTRNPASAFLAALQGDANPYPVADAEIDLDGIADWYDFCVAKGLKYDRVHDEEESLHDMLSAICAAGRAMPRHDGLRWGVVIDRPQSLSVDHVSPRNSSDFRWSRNYFDPPDGFRVTFYDETAGWEQAERVVPWPGHTGSIDLTEALELPGKTDPDEVAIEATRRMYELIHRPDQFTAIQSGAARVATRGDQVMGSFDTLDRTQVAARVVEVTGSLVVLDEPVTMEAGTDYAIRFAEFASPTDTIGNSVLADVRTVAGTHRSFTLKTGAVLPLVGAVVHFGRKASASLALRVRGIEPGEDFSAVLHMVAAAPEIDDMIDAYVPPAWNGIVGEEIDLDAIVALAPVFSAIRSGADPDADPTHVQYLLAPGAGSPVTVVSFEIDHKLEAAGSWSTDTITAAAGGGVIIGYSIDDEIEIRARPIADDGTPGLYSATIPFTVGSGALAIPAELDEMAIDVTGGLGHARIVVAVPGDDAIDRIRLYRVPSGDTLDRNLHGAGSFAVAPFTTVEHVDGDATRINLMNNPGFDDTSEWMTGAGWSIAAGKASHSAGSADAIEQALATTTGAYYRIAVSVYGATAGSVTPYLSGGSDRAGAAAGSNGRHLDRIQAVTGNDTFELLASTDFPGSVDDVVCFEETSSCIAQGAWDYYLEPVNASGAPGPLSTAFTAVIA